MIRLDSHASRQRRSMPFVANGHMWTTDIWTTDETSSQCFCLGVSDPSRDPVSLCRIDGVPFSDMPLTKRYLNTKFHRPQESQEVEPAVTGLKETNTLQNMELWSTPTNFGDACISTSVLLGNSAVSSIDPAGPPAACWEKQEKQLHATLWRQ